MIFDIIIIVLILLGAFSGLKKGLVGIIVGFIGLILSIVLAFALQGAVANYLYNDTGLGNSLSENIKNTLTEAFDKKVSDSLPENTQIKESGFYSDIIKDVTNIDQIGELSKNITMYILKGISFIIIFIVVYIICYILTMILNLVFDLPILNSMNKFGGIFAGALMSLMKIWILLAIISFLSPIPMFDGIVLQLKNSNLTNYLYSNNFIVYLISSNLKI